MFQRLLATEGLTSSEVSMKAGSTDRQLGSSSGSCGKEILLLPAKEVVAGGRAGLARREERQHLCPAEPLEGLLCSSSLLGDRLHCRGSRFELP